MHKSLSLAAAGAFACLLIAPMGAMAAAPGSASADQALSQTLVERVGDRDRDYDRGRDRDYDRDRGRDRDDDRGRGWRDRGDRDDYRGGYRHRCRFVRHVCADRFGWGGWRFRRCMWRRGCF